MRWTNSANPALPLLLALTAAARPPPAPSAQPTPTPPLAPIEQWVADQIAAGHPADLAAYPCPPPESAQATCRTLTGAFVARLITGAIVPPEKWQPGGLQLLSANITGPLDLSAAHIQGRVALRNTTLLSPVTLIDGRFDNSLLLECDTFDATVQGAGLRIDGSLSLVGSRFAQGVSMVGATVSGFIRAGSHIDQKLDLSNAHIGLTFAFAAMTPSPCSGPPPALPMDMVAGQGISLDAAEIGGNLQIAATVGHTGTHDAISANAAKVHGGVGLWGVINGGVDLQHSTVDGSVTLRGSTLSAPLKLAGAHIGNDLTLAGASFAGLVDLRGATIGQTLDLRGAIQPAAPSPPLRLDLENTHAGRLGDNQASWARVSHHIAGFTYGALVPPDPRDRPDQTWRRTWLAADDAETQLFDPQPYQQLAAVLAASGDKQKATAIAFWARQREREMAWQRGDYGHFFALSLLAFTVGYGIGAYTFVVLIWVMLISAAGAVVLGYSPAARAKGWLWRAQCGLDRLLPIIQLSPEFDDFFHDPAKVQLAGWQVLFFSLVAILGWLLGAFLAAALSGFTQGSS